MGDPVCWLPRVCDACGALSDDEEPETCARCGAEFAADEPQRAAIAASSWSSSAFASEEWMR